jgi:hypothetical protein
VLVVAVLTFAAPRSGRGGTVFGDCPPPGSSPSPFDVIGCRFVALTDTAWATVEHDASGRALNRVGGHAFNRFFNAASFCSFRHTNPARRRLRSAATLLDRYATLLRESAAAPDARDALVNEAVAIRDQIIALRARLACPNDV